MISSDKTVIAGFEYIRDIEKSGIPEYLHCKTGLLFVLVPAGNFLMGNQGKYSDQDESPVHNVTLTRPFLIARTPCTQQAWLNGISSENLLSRVDDLADAAKFPTFGVGTNKPVYHVTWLDSAKWCESNGLQLPTEAQWEYACRAGTTTEFHFGDVDMEEWDALDSHICYSENNNQEVPDVGAFQPNEWGLYDMHGTVWEWCQDRYDAEYYSNSNGIDPCNLKSGEKRVHRGGAWDMPPIGCRSSARYCDAEDYRLGSIGFRPILNL